MMDILYGLGFCALLGLMAQYGVLTLRERVKKMRTDAYRDGYETGYKAGASVTADVVRSVRKLYQA